MPTLVEVEEQGGDDSSSTSRQRRSLSMSSSTQNARGSANNSHRSILQSSWNRGKEDTGDVNSSDDSRTLSGSLLEDALHELNKNRSHSSTVALSTTRPESAASHLAHHEPSILSSPLNEENRIPRRRDNDGEVGPNECLYREKYADYVNVKLDEGRRLGKIRKDYRDMSVEEQQLEQDRVMRLLERLALARNEQQGGILETTTDNDENDRTVSILHTPLASNKSALRSTSKKNSSNQRSRSVSFANTIESPLVRSSTLRNAARRSSNRAVICDNDLDEEPMDESVALMSPPVRRPIYDDSSSDGSQAAEVEVPRVAQQRFESPVVQQRSGERKRLATTSGKRGMDLTRARNYSSNSPSSDRIMAVDDSLQHDTLDCSDAQILDETELFASREGDRNSLFSASQSPIVRNGRDPFRSSPNESPSLGQPDISLGDEDCDRSPRSSYTETTIDYSLTNAAATRHDVGLKAGATLYYKPLRTKPTHALRRGSLDEIFPDPLDCYPKRVSRRLARVLEKLSQPDSAGSDVPSTGKAIVLALEAHHIKAIVLKLLLDVKSPGQESRSSPSDETIMGNTLIIARERQELDDWSRLFREGSSLSVLNHATLPVKERKTRSTADLCSKYDVVVSTFDALKAPDVTFNVDSAGRLVTGKVGVEEGWFISRTASQSSDTPICKQFSVLHRLWWRRVVFVDVIGRKCFLVKKDTSRAVASMSLNSDAKFMFFTGQTDGSRALKSLMDSDKRAIASLAAILRAPSGKREEFLSRVTINAGLNRGAASGTK